jgi:hypothetical protein
MSNINLRQTNQKDESVRTAGVFSGSMIISIVIIMLSLGAWGGMEFYKRSISDQIDTIQAEIDSAAASISVKDLERVVAFQERAERIDKKIKTKNTPDTLFAALQQLVVPGSAIDEFEVTGKAVKVTMRVDTFQTAAKQAMSFKKSAVFSDVIIVGASKNEKEEIAVGLKMAIDPL